MNKLLFLIIVIFLINLTNVFAGNESHANDTYYYNASLIWNADNSLTEDNSSFAIVGVANGDPALVTDNMRCGRASVAFDGTGDYIGFDGTSLSGSMDAQENFSVEYWFKTTTSNTDYHITRLNAGSQTPYWRISITGTGQTVFLVAGTTNDWGGNCLVSTGNDDGIWHHIINVFNRTGSTKTSGQVYIDGTIIGTGGSCITDSDIGTTAGFRGTNLTIGAGEAGAQPSTTNLDGVIIHNRSLTSDEVEERYNNSDCTLLTNVTVAPGPPDTTPLDINLINLTEEGGLGQIIFGGGVEKNFTGEAKTNSSTATVHINTSEIGTCAMVDDNRALNYTDMIAYNPNSECSTTGGVDHHICTLTNDNATLTEGFYNFSVACKDANGNEKLNGTLFTINITNTPPPDAVILFLDGLNESRKYEFRSKVNISANCTRTLVGGCNITLSITSPNGLNVSTGINFTDFIFNITILRNVNFSEGPSSKTLTESGFVNVTSDNKTIMERVAFNITSAGTTTNINISYFSKEKRFMGDLKSIYLEQNEFLESNIFKKAINFTYTSGGSEFIFSNLTEIDNPINLSFRLSGFDLDADNEFNYLEQFNGTKESIGINHTLTHQVDAPLGVFDDFITNTSKWTFDQNCKEVTYETVPGFLTVNGDNCETSYNDNAADMRNTSKITVLMDIGIDQRPGGGDILQWFATDGTSSIEIGRTNANAKYANFTFDATKSDSTEWNYHPNVTGGQITDISPLDFDKPIKLKLKQGAWDFIRWDKVEWSGAWLNYSNNGTYNSVGNVTSKVLNVSKTNISKATLSVGDYQPDKTRIDYYLSNTCNNTIPIFEPVTPEISHTFASVGNEICWRAVLNSSNNFTSPVVRKVFVKIVSTSLENITVDLGNDGIVDFTHTGRLNSTTGSLFVNLTPTTNELNTIKISSASAGLLQVDQFKLNASINPVVLDETLFEDCTNCSINFNFSGSNLIVDALEFDFLGSWNYTAIATSNGFRDEKIIQIYYSNFNISLPGDYDWYDVFPSSNNATNVTPYLQTETTPIWNASNLAYDEPIDIYVRTNDTVPSCLNITYTNNSFRREKVVNESIVWENRTSVQLANDNLVNGSAVVFNQSGGLTIGANNYTVDYADGMITLNTTNASDYLDRTQVGINYSLFVHDFDLNQNFTFQLNQSYQKILTNISVDTVNFPSRGIWNWWNLRDCSNRFEIPWFFFSAICEDCVFKASYLGNLSIIET